MEVESGGLGEDGPGRGGGLSSAPGDPGWGAKANTLVRVGHAVPSDKTNSLDGWHGTAYAARALHAIGRVGERPATFLMDSGTGRLHSGRKRESPGKGTRH